MPLLPEPLTMEFDHQSPQVEKWEVQGFFAY